MSIDLTKVFDLNRNVLIEACAGAGKTWLLSKRYAHIMDEFARQHAENPQAARLDASNILVITFTRKAAAEMSERIYADLNLLLNDKTLDHVPEGFGQHLRQASPLYKMHVRSTFSKNAISTIDSFCTQILREQAEDLEIDPEFRIQDEVDTQRMELETWESFLRERSRKQDPDLKILLENLSEFHLNEYVKKLQSHAQLMKSWLDYHSSHTPLELEQNFKTENPLPVVLEQVEKSLIVLADGLPDPSEVLDPNHEHYGKLKELFAFFSDPIDDDYLYGVKIFEFVRLFTLTSKGDKYLDRVGIPGNVYPPEWADELRRRLKTLVENIKVLIPHDVLTQNIPVRWDLTACTVHHHLSTFFLSYWKALNERLKREGVLSFNEVIFQTHKLLQDPQIAAHYGKRYSHILFDEFQDTNDLRWDIVRLIAQNGQDSLRKKGLFIVGDTKQSIYRFNQADVQVMNRVQNSIRDEGGHILTADETYRSSRTFVDSVINPLISTSFPSPEDKDEIELYETVFQATVAAANSPLSDEQHELSRCQISVVLEDAPSKGSKADIIHTAELTVDWLKWIDEQKIPSSKGPAIGILLRTFTHILDFIRIFSSHGLDFEVLSSKGLFKQQESYDVYHLLSVLINPLDDLALVGLLRSPFFVLADAEIQALRDQNDERVNSGWVWYALINSRPEIVATIQTWQKQTAREPVDRLITQILSQDEYRLGWISETSGALRLANLERLIHLIHQLSLDGLSLREIFEYFKFQIQHGDASQAELPGSTRIQILSIHKSKGLEFPVVILPNLHSPPRSETGGIYLGRDGEQWQTGITLDSLKASHKTSRFERIKAQSQAEELAEDKRLFYVALTRARYGVGFIAKVKPGSQPQSNTWWSRYIKPVFDVEIDWDDINHDPAMIKKIWHERSTHELIYELVIGSEVLAEKTMEPQVSDQEIEFVDPIPEPLIYEEISPHSIMNWMDSSSSGSSKRNPAEDSSNSEGSALTFGRLLHRAMEMEWFDVGTYSEEICHYLENEELVDPLDQQIFLNDLRDCLSIYRQSKLAEKLAGLKSENKLAELPVFGYLQSDTRVYKVSGIIDLLYEDGDEWIVLDYKSDKELPLNPELKNYSYWYQIQTYLWILKLMYGIQARGELYFNRFDKTLSIDYEEDLYFSRLDDLAHARGLRPNLGGGAETSTELRSVFEQLNPRAATILLETTKYSGERTAQALAKAGLNHPRLQVMTLNDFRKFMDPPGRRLTPYLTRLALANILGKQVKWGLVNRLASAFYNATQGESVVPSKEALYARFLDWCDKHGIFLPDSKGELGKLSRDASIVINSIHSTSAADYQFLSHLAKIHNFIFVNPMAANKIQSGFNMSIADWARQDEIPSNLEGHHFTSCFSVREEVLLCANNIREKIKQGSKPADILVAVSSMERYVPSIKQIFSDYGISVRISKREPVMERPVIQLAFALIQGRLVRNLSWDQAMSVWLHPLVLPSGTAGNQRLRLDIEARKLGITILDESLADQFTHEKMKQAAGDLLKFVSQIWRGGQKSGLAEESEWLDATLSDFQFTHRLDPGSVASKAYTSLKNALISIRTDWGRYLNREGSLGDLHRELKERLKGVEVSSSQQGFGVDVISLLDSLNLRSKHLFMLGLTEGQFPLAPDPNPYLKPSLLNPWFLNLYLFKHWLERPKGSLHFSSPVRNIDGASLQESTFCQYLEQKDYPRLSVVSRGQYLDQMANKLFKQSSSIHQNRHNDLLRNPGQGSWYGKLAPQDRHSFDQISASAFDELIKCPQRYWYERILNLEPAETNIAERHEIEVGNLVHKVLEKFGKAGGFLLVPDDLDSALELLESTAGEIIAEKEIDLDADLLDSKWRELYFKNFQDPEQNLLAAMLRIESETLAEFKDIGLHEQAFGDPDDENSWPLFEVESDTINLALRGKIDRVFVSEKHVWATDYKTGEVDIKDSREFWTSQMLFYYLVLKSRYPDKDVVLTYEQLKAFKDGTFGFKGYLGDTASENPVMETKSPRAKSAIPISEGEEWSMERIRTETLGYAQHLADNSFPLTERDEKKACAYCHFERICRKTALPR